MMPNSCSRELVVLAYHRIGSPGPDGWDTWHQIPTPAFVQQLTFLQDDGWNVIDGGTFLSGLSDPSRLPLRSVLLTFDDGCRCIHDIVLPILGQFGFPAVLFIPTDYIGKSSSFDQGVEPEVPICGWPELRELDRHGVSVQSHGAAHYWFSLHDAKRQAHELIVSKRILEDKLGTSVEMFAFPYSDAGSDRENSGRMLAGAGYRAAFLCGGGPSRNCLPLPDPFHIDRLAVYRDTNLNNELGVCTVRRRVSKSLRTRGYSDKP